MIYFDPLRHIYYNERKIIYDSPSKILKQYKQEFNSVEAATAYAVKHGETPEHWLKVWQDITEESLERGTGIHQDREDISNVRVAERHEATGKAYPVKNASIVIKEELKDLLPGVYNELILWNHPLMLSGTADKVVIEKVLSKTYAHIDDYKTNKEIKKQSYFCYKTLQYRRMQDPVSYLMDCNHIHYALQFSIYQYMLELAGFTPGKRTLIHIPHPIKDDQGEIIFQPEDVHYDMPYLRTEVEHIIEHYNANRTIKYYEHGAN